MADWALHIPHRSRADRLDPTDVLEMGREILGAEDAKVAASLALELVGECDTYGEVLDRLEATEPAERRALLDRARVSAGLLPTDRAEQRLAFEQANAPRPSQAPRGAGGTIEARCAHPTCRRFLPHERLTGAAAAVNCRRWWCEKHRAGHEEDMKPYSGPRLAYSPSGVSIVNLDERERERRKAEAEAESRRRRYEARLAQRRADGEKLAALKQASDERQRREQPRGLRP